MSDEVSPWASSETQVVLGPLDGSSPAGSPGRPAPDPAGPSPAQGNAVPWQAAGGGGQSPYRSGMVTGLRRTDRSAQTGGEPADGRTPAELDLARERRLKRIFVAVAGAVLAVGLVVVVGMVATGHTGRKPFASPPDTRPALAKLCPPPSDASPGPLGSAPPPPAGDRTVDEKAGISYAAYGSPWLPWEQVWSAGELHVVYSVGQHFITEEGISGSGYHASILSGSVPATVNDAMIIDLECTGRRVAADVRNEYYFQPNTIEMLRDERTVLGGRAAWVTKFRLHFSAPGLRATDELAAVALIDVGRPEAAILYVSIPGTHRQFDHVVDEVIDSVRPT